mgnify:CR=1 FL=1
MNNSQPAFLPQAEMLIGFADAFAGELAALESRLNDEKTRPQAERELEQLTAAGALGKQLHARGINCRHLAKLRDAGARVPLLYLPAHTCAVSDQQDSERALADC